MNGEHRYSGLEDYKIKIKWKQGQSLMSYVIWNILEVEWKW